MFTIRQAQLCDLSAIKELAAITVPQAFAGVLTTEQIDYLEDLSYSQSAVDISLAAGQIFFIATADGEDCGYACVQPEGPDLFHMPKIYVLSRKQHQGIGSALLEKIVAHIKAIHPAPCVLEVNVNRHNHAIDFYLKRGFDKVRERTITFENGFTLIQDVLQRQL